MRMTTTIEDHVIVCLNNGTFDLFKVDASGERVLVRGGFPTLDDASSAARAELTSDARLWLCDETTPDDLRPY
jgi:hypothetical protein